MSRRLTFSLSDGSYERLSGLAKRKGVSMSDILREALRREVWLERVLEDEALFLRDEAGDMLRVISV